MSLDQLEGAHADLMASVGLPSGVLAMPGVIELLHAFAKITKPELRAAALAAVAGIAKVPAVTAPARLKLVEAKADLTSRVA
ncbi:hypothetical protein ASG52_11705 [Methylobacterium sp. Leaf456]|uniref:hypothetical protein n=1 Tax=Methylobacterium sp. Leaf456 TaxID=1736382 RepID=UPI0006F9D7F0|nr:hypothetical protein [Methylobacterium sp. Leaf456]KQT47917.1 hypothetical protein ASG52_11705 [Methylobacterium sp. Leaf456]